MTIKHSTIKSPGDKLFAVADWNANHTGTAPPDIHGNEAHSSAFIDVETDPVYTADKANIIFSGDNVSELVNDAGYLTAEADTLQSVTTRGATTNKDIQVSSVDVTDETKGYQIDGAIMLSAKKGADYYNDNIFLGRTTPTLDPLAAANIFLGGGAGEETTTGGENVFVGMDAGASNTEGSYNLFYANNAGWGNTIGNVNTFIGYGAGYTNSEGDGNIYFGHTAGAQNEGDGNVFIGYQAGFDEKNTDNKLIISNIADWNFIEGDFSAKTLKIDGELDVNSHKIINVLDPTDPQDAVTKAYGDANYGVGVVSDQYDIPKGNVFGSQVLREGYGYYILGQYYAWFLYLGKTTKAFTPKYIYWDQQNAAGSTTGEVGLFYSAEPPNRDTNQVMNKIVATGAVTDAWTSAGFKRNTTAFTTEIAAGVHLWVGIRHASATSPQLRGCYGDVGQGAIRRAYSLDALTTAGPWTAAKIGFAVTSSGSGPYLQVSLV